MCDKKYKNTKWIKKLTCTGYRGPVGYWNIPVILDDALRWYGKRIDKEYPDY